MTTSGTERRDPRIERVIRAAEQHGTNSEPDHEVGDLQDLLRSAWSLMSPDQRDQLMAAAETLNVLQHGDDFVEVAELRACLLREDGLHRVLIEVTRDGEETEPRITSFKVFDAVQSEVDWRAVGFDPSELKLLAGRLDEDLLQASYYEQVEVVPAWVSTIDWDLERDELTRSVRVQGDKRIFQPSRWLNASERLDCQAPPVGIEVWREEPLLVVMELSPTLGRAMPRWAELALNAAAIAQLREGESVALGGTDLPVRAGGAAKGKLPSTHLSAPGLEVIGFGQEVQLRGLNAEGWPMSGARVPLRLFLQWAGERHAGETLFVSGEGQLLNDLDEFARHYLWVDEYHRSLSPAFVEPESEFDGERPRG